MGWKWKTTSDGQTRRMPDVCYDVPLLSSLQCLLEKSPVLEQVCVCIISMYHSDDIRSQLLLSGAIFGISKLAVLRFQFISMPLSLWGYVTKHRSELLVC